MGQEGAAGEGGEQARGVGQAEVSIKSPDIEVAYRTCKI